MTKNSKLTNEMKRKKISILAIVVLSLTSMVKTFGVYIDTDNPYMDVSVEYKYKSTENQFVWLDSVLEKGYEGWSKTTNLGRPDSDAPKGHLPESIYFRVIINDGNDSINIEHDINATNSFEEIFKKEFTINEKKGVIFYKTIVNVIEYPIGSLEDSNSTNFNASESSNSTNFNATEALDSDNVVQGYRAIDSLKIKFLYAELDGKEMRQEGFNAKDIDKVSEKCVKEKYGKTKKAIKKGARKVKEGMKKVEKKAKKKIKKAIDQVVDWLYEDED